MVTGHSSCSEWDHTCSCLSLTVPHLFLFCWGGNVLFQLSFYLFPYDRIFFFITSTGSTRVLNLWNDLCSNRFLQVKRWRKPSGLLWNNPVSFLSSSNCDIFIALYRPFSMKPFESWFVSSCPAGPLRAHSWSQTEERIPPPSKGCRAESWLNMWSSLVSSVLKCVQCGLGLFFFFFIKLHVDVPAVCLLVCLSVDFGAFFFF